MVHSQARHTVHRSKAVADRLRSAAIHLLRRLRKEDDASGLSGPRLSALSVIVFRGPITLSDLSVTEQVRPPTMTRIVAALQNAGLVKVRRNPIDARAIHISATSKGVRRFEQGRAGRLTSLSRKLSRLRADERRLLGRASLVMERIARMLD